MIEGSTTLGRRLERYRAATRGSAVSEAFAPSCLPGPELAERLAAALDGEIVRTAEGVIVRCEVPSRTIAVDRDRLATLPGQPPPETPLVCLDTETTGLATAAGTVAWLIGLGWWEGDRFRQVQLLLPDHPDERALLTALSATIAPTAWLVTYNGRGFDWPLLVTRYRMVGRPPPNLAGHLDLLPIVRRLFRHRMENARLRTAEADLLGLHRIGDVEGWEIPSRYLQFLLSGSAEGVAEVVRHNDQDVRSLARLLVHLETQFGDADGRGDAVAGDLAGLARAYTRERRLDEALACLDAAIERAGDPPRPAIGRTLRETAAAREEPWWSPRRPADYGGRPSPVSVIAGSPRTAAFHAPWTTERMAVDRAHVLRRLGRVRDAADAWDGLAAGTGRTAILASIELAKLQEHRLRDRPGALRSALRGLAAIDRRRRLGRPDPALEADLHRRVARLRRLVGRADVKVAASRAG